MNHVGTVIQVPLRYKHRLDFAQSMATWGRLKKRYLAFDEDVADPAKPYSYVRETRQTQSQEDYRSFRTVDLNLDEVPALLL